MLRASILETLDTRFSYIASTIYSGNTMSIVLVRMSGPSLALLNAWNPSLS
uniref:Uncharacterized protein n=1 Tax=Rhizophora mucronata TaxID=61149 RepID=A0A2P2PIJ7_RHIMU